MIINENLTQIEANGTIDKNSTRAGFYTETQHTLYVTLANWGLKVFQVPRKQVSQPTNTLSINYSLLFVQVNILNWNFSNDACRHCSIYLVMLFALINFMTGGKVVWRLRRNFIYFNMQNMSMYVLRVKPKICIETQNKIKNVLLLLNMWSTGT